MGTVLMVTLKDTLVASYGPGDANSTMDNSTTRHICMTPKRCSRFCGFMSKKFDNRVDVCNLPDTQLLGIVPVFSRSPRDK